MASHEKRPAIRLSTIIRKKYIAVQLLGKGGYGIVYEVMQLTCPANRFACKTELATLRNNLKSEWDVMTVMSERKSKHFIIAHEMGQERNYNYIIMNVVGPTLADLRKCILPNKKFTLYTTCVMSIQCFDALHELHLAGFIHRDVKPSNYAIGLPGTDKEKLIYILDFGICRKIYQKSGKLLRKPRAKVPFRGTTQYCSPNVHLRMEPGRHDDFWSMLYMMIEFHTGDLPWEKMTKDEIKKCKETKTDELLEKCPVEFRYLKMYIRTLSYRLDPDYAKIRNILCQIMRTNEWKGDKPLDWQNGGEYSTIFKPMRRIEERKKTLNPVKEKLEDIISIPADFPKYTEADFPDQEEEPQHNESTSKSDDTIIDKSVIIKNVPTARTEKKDVNSPEKIKTKTIPSKNNVKPQRKNTKKKR